MKNAKKRKLFGRLFFLGLFTVASLYIFFNPNGLLHYLKLKSELINTKEKIKQVEKDIKKLDAEIDSLKTNNLKIEKVAREKYNMKSKNEEVIDIEESE